MAIDPGLTTYSVDLVFDRFSKMKILISLLYLSSLTHSNFLWHVIIFGYVHGFTLAFIGVPFFPVSCKNQWTCQLVKPSYRMSLLISVDHCVKKSLCLWRQVSISPSVIVLYVQVVQVWHSNRQESKLNLPSHSSSRSALTGLYQFLEL